MKIFHFADLHLDPATEENTAPALDCLLEAARREQPDLIVNAGDLSFRRGHLAPWVGLALRRFHVELSRMAPTIVVAGNHDLSTAGRGVGTVLGALGESAAGDGEDDYGLYLCERPVVQRFSSLSGALHVACLPYPSRDWLLAGRPELKPSDLLPELSRLLLETLHGLAAQVPAGQRAILVYHGTIASARTDSEHTMTPEIDVVLNEAEIPACFEAVLCGHIHRHQQIGRAVYAGSPAPLTFAEERGEHGYVLWTERSDIDPGLQLEPGAGWRYRHVPIPVAHPLLTVDLQRLGPVYGHDDFGGARVRVRLMLGPGESPEALREKWTRFYVEAGAAEVRVLIERPEEQRIAGPEVRADASMDGLLSLYAERHPEVAPLLDELKALARTIEERLPPDARMRAAAAGYRLLALRWDNWKNYGAGNALDLESLGRLVAIEGDNASGKSNAAEVECFALYGRFIRGRQALAEAVRIGAQEALVAAEFEVSGVRYKVERRIRVNSKGVGSQVLALFRAAPYAPLKIALSPEFVADLKMEAPLTPLWLPASLGSARETQDLIEELVGPFELYLKTRFASQGEIDALLDLTPAELKDVLQQALAAQLFEERERIARPLTMEAERAAERHDDGLRAWREEAELAPARAEQLERALNDLDAARRELAAAEHAVKVAEAEHEEAEHAVASVTERGTAWDRAQAELAAAREKVARLANEIAWHEAQARQSAAAAERLQALPALEERLRGLRDAQGLCTARRAALEAARQLVAERERALRQHHGLRAARREEILTRLGRLEEAHGLEKARDVRTEKDLADRGLRGVEQAIESLKDAERRAALVEQAPFGEKCAEAACPLLADALEARGLIEARREGISTARRAAQVALEESAREVAGRRERFDADRLALQRERDECGNGPDERQRELEAGVLEGQAAARMAGAAVAEVDLDEVGLQRLEAEHRELMALGPAIERGRQAQAALPLLQEASREAGGETERRAGEHAATGHRPDPDRAARAAAEASERATALAAARDAMLRASEEAIEQAAAARVRLERAQEAAGKLAGAQLEAERLAQAARVASVYLEAVGRNGLPYLMLERALPALEGHANHFLCDDLGSGLRLEIEACRELQSGEQRSEVLIRYANDFGTHSLAAASGFERTAIGYALRAALAQVQSEAQGVTLSHWIADEGWGVFDEQNIVRVAQPMLRRLAERFGRVIVISHQAPIREVCDTRLRVVGDPSRGSRLERAE